jgi:hypothetical protein
MPVNGEPPSKTEDLIERMDAVHRRICASQLELLCLIAQVDACEGWRDDGARDMAHWLWMRYGISDWKARRWIACAHALQDLPRTLAAFATGELGIDKAVELTRFATPETEVDLLGWAVRVSPGAIRERGDREIRRSLSQVQAVEEDRSLSWWSFDEGRRSATATASAPSLGAGPGGSPRPTTSAGGSTGGPPTWTTSS